MRVRSQPYPRLRVLILPSTPVRHFTVRRNAGRCSSARRAAEGLPLRGHHDLLHAEVVQVVLDGFLAVAAVAGDRARGASRAFAGSDPPLAPVGVWWSNCRPSRTVARSRSTGGRLPRRYRLPRPTRRARAEILGGRQVGVRSSRPYSCSSTCRPANCYAPPNPLSQAEVTRIRGAREAGPPPRPSTEPRHLDGLVVEITVKRRASNTGGVMSFGRLHGTVWAGHSKPGGTRRMR